LRSQIARLPTKSEGRWIALRLTLGALVAAEVALLLLVAIYGACGRAVPMTVGSRRL
jgi:hypothetical protein